MPPARQPINHGTVGGFNTHYKRGIPPCQACRAARNAATAAYRSVLIVCADCGRQRRREAKGMCSSCYARSLRLQWRSREWAPRW